MITFSTHVVTNGNKEKFEQEVTKLTAEGFIIQGFSTALVDMTAMVYSAVMTRGKKS